MSNYTARDLDTLQRQAQQIQQVLAANRAADRQAYAVQQQALDQDKEAALRQAYVGQQQAITQLPAQLAAAGINGGAAESSIVQLQRGYGNHRGDITANYNRAAASLRADAAANATQHEAAAAQDKLDYLGAQSAIRAYQEQLARQEQLALKAQQAQQAQQAAAPKVYNYYYTYTGSPEQEPGEPEPVPMGVKRGKSTAHSHQKQLIQ